MSEVELLTTPVLSEAEASVCYHGCAMRKGSLSIPNPYQPIQWPHQNQHHNK
jgi:hypothetical protein